MSTDKTISAKDMNGENLKQLPKRRISTKIDYLNLIPPLSVNEHELLKKSIQEKGQLVPAIVNQEGTVLDGMHRFRACKELGIPFRTITMKFKDRAEEKLFLIEVNLRRRHLNLYQRIELGYSLETILTKDAKERMSLGGIMTGLGNRKEHNSDGNERLASVEATLESLDEKGKVAKIIANKIGVSTSMYERGKKIIKEANESEKNRLRGGDTSVTRVYNQIRKQEIAQTLVKNQQTEGDMKAK